MTRDELRQAVLAVLRNVAPEADLSRLAPDAPIRDQLDVDSIDFMRFLIGISETLHVDVPEADYPKVASLDGLLQYLGDRLAG
ncbi:MAG: acyl carrier protein [Gemmatimonadota bacterium]